MIICGTKLDKNTGMRRRKFNKELIEETEMTPIKYYIRCQKIQWFGHIIYHLTCLGNQRVRDHEDALGKDGWTWSRKI